MTSPSFAGALFDLDGTLVDREPLMTEAVVRVMARTGMPIGHEQAAGWVGRAWQDVHAELGVQDVLGWDVTAWHARIVAQGEELFTEGFPVRTLTGGRELMARLVDGGTRVGIVTGSTHREVAAVVELLDLGSLVSVVVASEDYDDGKPHPAPFLLGADRLGVMADACVAFEDSMVGVRSALAAGMTVIGTLEANAEPGSAAFQDLAAAHAVVDRLADVDGDVLVAAFARSSG